LASIEAAKVPAGWRVSILVVDNGSTDSTPQDLRGHRSHFEFMTVCAPTPGLSNARNVALQHADSAYVLFTDDDVLVSEEWLTSFCAAATETPAADVFAGPVEPWFSDVPDPAILSAFADAARGFCGTPPGGGPDDPIRGLVGANMGFRRAAIKDVRFDPLLGNTPGSLMGYEETDFVKRVLLLGGDIVWVSGMRLLHFVEPSRLKLSYLRKLTIDRHHYVGRHLERDAAPMLFGAPRWLWGGLARSILDMLRAAGIFDRLALLTSLAEVWRHQGMIRGARARRLS
jgi:GT2 family glycosyltransferase